MIVTLDATGPFERKCRCWATLALLPRPIEAAARGGPA
jgi:hypothetical protein